MTSTTEVELLLNQKEIRRRGVLHYLVRWRRPHFCGRRVAAGGLGGWFKFAHRARACHGGRVDAAAPPRRTAGAAPAAPPGGPGRVPVGDDGRA